MASIASESNGRRRILFADIDAKRKTIRLGKMTKKDAEGVRVKIESLLGSKVSGQPAPQETSRWIAQVGDTLHEELSKVGLV